MVGVVVVLREVSFKMTVVAQHTVFILGAHKCLHPQFLNFYSLDSSVISCELRVGEGTTGLYMEKLIDSLSIQRAHQDEPK